MVNREGAQYWRYEFKNPEDGKQVVVPGTIEFVGASSSQANGTLLSTPTPQGAQVGDVLVAVFSSTSITVHSDFVDEWDEFSNESAGAGTAFFMHRKILSEDEVHAVYSSYTETVYKKANIILAYRSSDGDLNVADMNSLHSESSVTALTSPGLSNVENGDWWVNLWSARNSVDVDLAVIGGVRREFIANSGGGRMNVWAYDSDGPVEPSDTGVRTALATSNLPYATATFGLRSTRQVPSEEPIYIYAFSNEEARRKYRKYFDSEPSDIVERKPW